MSTKKSVFSWCLYDWANSAFGAVIITFVFSVFFTDHIVGDSRPMGLDGSALWSYAISVSGLLIAILSPFLGSFADHYGRLKRFVFAGLLVCVLATAGCFFAPPDAGISVIFLVCSLVIVANLALELSIVFYNAMLPHIAPADRVGRISGWGWALGYIGGLFALVSILLLFIGLGEGLKPFLSLPQDGALHVRISILFVAGWMLVFSLPLFLWAELPQGQNIGAVKAWKSGISELKQLFVQFRTHGNFLRFLIGSAIYRDGLATLFAVGGVYAAFVHNMSFSDLLVFGVVLNVTAGIGAFIFSFIDDYLGSKRTIVMALFGLIGFGLVVLIVNDKMLFMVFTALLGIFIGPAQAAGRTMVTRLVREEDAAQAYGLYAMCGKSIAFTGPLLYGLAISMTGSQKAGLSVILLLWVIGLILVWGVREKREGQD